MNTAETLQGRLDGILLRQLKLVDVAALAPGVMLDDLGLDSLGLLAFVAAIEREFGVSVSDRDYEELQTYDDALALVTRLARG